MTLHRYTVLSKILLRWIYYMFDYTTTRAFTKNNQYDLGLRQYMMSVYKYMTFALAVTAIVAFWAASSPKVLNVILYSPLKWVVMLAPFAMAIYMGARIMRMSLQTAKAMLAIFSALMGLSISYVFVYYTGQSIARVFAISAAMFGGMSLYGYTTKRDLTRYQSFFFMGLIGIIIASLVNLFLHSSMMHFMLSIATVLVFTFFTAYDTQKLKEIYYRTSGGSETTSKIAVYGALSLYLDFINLFLALLQLFGMRRN